MDGYGGNALKRRMLLIEVLRSVRSAVGPTFALAIKLNSADFQRGGFSEEESATCIGFLSSPSFSVNPRPDIILYFLDNHRCCYNQRYHKSRK